MAVRPMVAEPDACSDRPMDEATLECSWCGGPAVAEYRVEQLDDLAEWRGRTRWTACATHLEYVTLRVAGLRHDQRIVAMRCS